MQDQAILLVDAHEVVDTEEVLDVTINNTCTGVTFTFTDILYSDNMPGCLETLEQVAYSNGYEQALKDVQQQAAAPAEAPPTPQLWSPDGLKSPDATNPAQRWSPTSLDYRYKLKRPRDWNLTDPMEYVGDNARAMYKYKPEWESVGNNIRRRTIQPNLNKPEAQGHSCKTKLIAKFGPLLD